MKQPIIVPIVINEIQNGAKRSERLRGSYPFLQPFLLKCLIGIQKLRYGPIAPQIFSSRFGNRNFCPVLMNNYEGPKGRLILLFHSHLIYTERGLS